MYKSRLQELCQKKKWRLPEYTTTKHGLDHNPQFRATITINGVAFYTPQMFRSSKEAQNDAAKLAFHHFSDPLPISSTANPIPSPSSFPQPSLPSDSSALPSTVGTGLSSMHDTKQTLQPKTQETHQTPHVPVQFSGKSDASSQSNGSTSGFEDGNIDKDIQHLYKNQLQTYAQKRNLLLPVYSCEREGPPHNCRFKSRVTIDGQTYGGQELFPSLKEAEHAAAKAAIMSLLPNGVQEANSGLYKNLLQELLQKEGFSVPLYSTKISGEPNMPVFVSTVEIEGEPFRGPEARSKKQAELSAAKAAYHTLRERKSSRILSPAVKGQEASEILSSSFQSNLAGDRQQGRSNASSILIPHTNTSEQTKKKENSVAADGNSHHFVTVSSGPDALMREGGFSSSEIVCGRAQDTSNAAEGNIHHSVTVSSGSDALMRDGGFSSSNIVYGGAQDTSNDTPSESQNGWSSSMPSDCSANLVSESTLEPPAKWSMYNKVSVYPSKPNMIYPEGTTILPTSDEKWVAFSYT